MDSPATRNDYYGALARLHEALRPRTYLEIGVADGQSLSLARTDTLCVGVDPDPTSRGQRPQLPSNAVLFEEESDVFFATRDLHNLLHGEPLDFAFIDGKHLFEYALRDFMNIEANSQSDTVVAVHDCRPLDAVTSSRERTTNVWTGDVWKLVACLRAYRPDLDITLVDVPPSGLCIISGLDRRSSVLRERYEALLGEFVPLGWDCYETELITTFSGMIAPLRDVIERVSAIRDRRPGEAVSTEFGATLVGRAAPELLGVLLCYNDSDMLPDAIDHMLANGHEIIVWDHGSSDATPEILDKYAGNLLERRLVPREFDFYKLYGAMSQHLIAEYADRVAWISWPDQDEILEGPRRDRSYEDYVREVLDSPYNWVRFRNFNFWVTTEDDSAVVSPTQRIRHYSLMTTCAPRIRAWRAPVTNIREFNHNPLPGLQFPELFNLRHYSARTYEQLDRRVLVDRAGLRRGDQNWHYDGLREHLADTRIPASGLLWDDGVEDLVAAEVFDWQSIYAPPPL